MTFTKILTAALLPCALMAAPAFAQSSATDAEDYAKDKMETTQEDVKIMSDIVVETEDGAIIAKGDPLTLETPSNIITATDGEVNVSDNGVMLKGTEIVTHSKMKKVEMMDPEMMEAAPAAMPTEVTTVVTACPEGTTAQDNGTCMITGDYEE